MQRTHTSLSILGLLAAVGVAENSAVAAPAVAGYTGEAPSSVAGCPYLLWRVARHDNGGVTGIFYYSDMSGVSMVSGTINQAGQFKLTLTSSMGNGPVGTVIGTKVTNGAVDATMKGEGCANMRLRFNPNANLNKYNPTGIQPQSWVTP